MLFFRGISLLGLALGLGLHREVNYTIVNRKVRNAMKKCNYFMEEAFECDPAKQKINKEGFILQLKFDQSELSKPNKV